MQVESSAPSGSSATRSQDELARRGGYRKAKAVATEVKSAPALDPYSTTHEVSGATPSSCCREAAGRAKEEKPPSLHPQGGSVKASRELSRLRCELAAERAMRMTDASLLEQRRSALARVIADRQNAQTREQVTTAL